MATGAEEEEVDVKGGVGVVINHSAMEGLRIANQRSPCFKPVRASETTAAPRPWVKYQNRREVTKVSIVLVIPSRTSVAWSMQWICKCYKRRGNRRACCFRSSRDDNLR